jgi:formylglycine-generating enzyme required for sulfatase activity
MGADTGGEQDEHPAHSVTIAPFFLDKTEVTQEAYAECVAANVCRPQSEVVQGVYPGSKGPKKPVNGVAWDDANTYCAWRHKRLPREAEFERAVRDDDGRRFPWGNDKPSPDKTVFNRAIGPNPGQTTDDVGTHPLGRGPYGQDDLAGNVWEWQSDLYDPYAYRRAGAPRGEPGTCDEIMAALNELRTEGKQGFTGTNPIPTECEHSIRGGAFNYPPEGLRSTNRVHHPGRYRIPMLGFRCAMDAK